MFNCQKVLGYRQSDNVHLYLPYHVKRKEKVLKENGLFRLAVVSFHCYCNKGGTSKHYYLEMAKSYKFTPVELALSPKEHFEDNLYKFINNETIADDKK